MTSPVRRARAAAVLAHVEAGPDWVRRQWPGTPIRRDGILFSALLERGLNRREVDLALDDLVEDGRITLTVEDGWVAIRLVDEASR